MVGGGRNLRRSPGWICRESGFSDRAAGGFAGVGGDQEEDGLPEASRSGPVASTVGGRKGEIRSGRVGWVSRV